MNKFKIPFNKIPVTGNEVKYIKAAIKSGYISGDGCFTKRCQELMEERYSVNKVLLTPSGTAALEMAAMLCDFSPGDEVIMPSYSFVSTANAFLLCNAKIKFVDIRKDTLNIDERLIEEAINSNTKAIVVVHYGGVSCEMDKICILAKKYGLFIIEDAAHAIEAKYKDKYLGTIGEFGCISFHESKNITSGGEGGALFVNDERFLQRAEIIREKGTDRSRFFRGEIDKYTWRDIGSSYLMPEISSAFLYAQLENIEKLTLNRLNAWKNYYLSFESLEKKGCIRRPVVPAGCKHNGHIFYLLLKSQDARNRMIKYLKSRGILSVFHYIPLHLSPMGQKLYGQLSDLKITEEISERILRLPLYYNMPAGAQENIIREINEFF